MMSFITGFLPPWLHIIVGVASFGGLGVIGFFAPAYKVLIKIAAVVLAVGFIYFSGRHSGYDKAEKIGKSNLEEQAATAKTRYDGLVTSYDKATKEANVLAKEKADALKIAVDTISINYNRILKESNDKSKLLRDASKTIFVVSKDSSGRDIVSVTGGLSINALGCTKSDTGDRVQTASGPAATRELEAKTEARLDGKTSGDLISLVTDGDAAIVQLNAVIDAYNRVQESGCTIGAAPSVQPKPKP